MKREGWYEWEMSTWAAGAWGGGETRRLSEIVMVRVLGGYVGWYSLLRVGCTMKFVGMYSFTCIG